MRRSESQPRDAINPQTRMKRRDGARISLPDFPAVRTSGVNESTTSYNPLEPWKLLGTMGSPAGILTPRNVCKRLSELARAGG